MDAGEFDRAIAANLKGASIDPESPVWWRRWGTILAKRGEQYLAQRQEQEGALCLESAHILGERFGWESGFSKSLQRALDDVKGGGEGVLVPRGATWKYLDDGSDQGKAWSAPGFGERGWNEGEAPLGYDDGSKLDEVTPIKTSISFGDKENKHLTSYFRTSVELAEGKVPKGLFLRLRRDDGAVVYLNGKEIGRSNMPAGPVTFETTASSGMGENNEGNFFDVPVTGSAPLRPGRNVVAVEVHQVDPKSSDLGFDLELSYKWVRPAAISDIPALKRLEEQLKVPDALRSLLWAARAQRFAEGKEKAKALECLEQALALEPDELIRDYLRVQETVLGGDHGRALDLYREVLDRAADLEREAMASKSLLMPASLLAASKPRKGPASPDPLETLGNDLPGWERELLGQEQSERLEIEIASLQSSFDAVDVRKRKDLLREKELLLEGFGRSEDAAKVRGEIFAHPPRDPELPDRMLDLSKFYNASLYGDRGWYWVRPSRDSLRFLPESYDPEKHVRFDLRGLVQLSRRAPSPGTRADLPDRVRGIPVDKAAPAIHFLLGGAAAQGSEPGELVGRLVLHFDEADPEPVDLINQENIADVWSLANQTIDSRFVAWTAVNPEDSDRPYQLINYTWVNPRPAEPVRSIDFVSANARMAPFLVAITLEPTIETLNEEIETLRGADSLVEIRNLKAILRKKERQLDSLGRGDEADAVREELDSIVQKERATIVREELAPPIEESIQDPADTLLALKLAALQVWYGDDAGHAATSRRMLDWALKTDDNEAADRVAKLSSLRRAADAATREEAVALAQKAVELWNDDGAMKTWALLALGMATYRDDDLETAAETLGKAADGIEKFSNPDFATFVGQTAFFYRVMCLIREGDQSEARALFKSTVEKMKPLPEDPSGANHNGLILWLAYQEAAALLDAAELKEADDEAASHQRDPKTE